ncbi:MAG: peptide chain release factor 3 [Alphaproteobacteria bacterium]
MSLDASLAPAGARPDASPAARRRTFAIISHPDAGKTTLTEKLLLLGGAIHLAGAVKAKGERRRARSDWMKIEQARGISVTTSVMTFERDGTVCNLLDTPGHEDFSEDTYRTLTAVDSAVMVIDAAKGIEAQTRKLFEVCRLRDVPIITFINKVDREGRDPFALLDEIASTLALDVCPMNWPLGQADAYKGHVDLATGTPYLFGPADARGLATLLPCRGLDDPALVAALGTARAATLAEEVALAEGGYPGFDRAAYREGHLTPVFFGSALRTLGVEELLGALTRLAPSPRPQPAEPTPVEPEDGAVSGFVFKVQANMDPNHRDRVAFVRLCSGRFRRGMKLRQVRTGKQFAVHNPILFFARERELAEEAYAGDIIGVPNHGTLRVGDALSEGADVRFTGIPNFAPEILRRVRIEDPMKAKHLRRALESLAEEGVTQVFRPKIGNAWIVGVVGQLQLDVLVARLAAEYDLEVALKTAPCETARWLSAADPAELKRFVAENQGVLAEDGDGAPVFLARNAWELNYIREKWPNVRFHATKERA